MNKRGLVNWAIWIGVASAIYVALYAIILIPLTGSVLGSGWHVMCATFTALPIYFISGAQRGEFWKFIGSNIVGVLWAMVYLVCMDRLAAAGLPFWLNGFIVIAVICTVECAIHFVLPDWLPFNKVPAHFGAISNSFWCSNLTIALLGTGKTSIGGMYNFSAFLFLTITLCCGVTLALICNEGLNFIDAETGKWRWPVKKEKAPQEVPVGK